MNFYTFLAIYFLCNIVSIMKVSQSITGKYNYTELKVASEGEGSVVLNGKRSDNGAKVIIFGQHVPSESNKKRQSSNSKTTFSVPSS